MNWEPRHLAGLWTSLLDAWGGAGKVLHHPPAVAAGRLNVTSPDRGAFQHVMVALTLGPATESQVRPLLDFSDRTLRERVNDWAHPWVFAGDLDFVTVVCLGVEDTPPEWWADVQDRCGGQVRYLSVSDLRTLAGHHPKIFDKYFGDEALRAGKVEAEARQLSLDNKRLQRELLQYRREYEEVAGRRRRLNAALAYQEAVVDLRHTLAADIYRLRVLLASHHFRAREQWPDDMLDSLFEAAQGLARKMRQYRTPALKRGARMTVGVAEIADVARRAAKGDPTVHVPRPAGHLATLRVSVELSGLEDCFVELYANARHWFDLAKTTDPMIRVSYEKRTLPNDEALDIVVADNGPGVDDQQKSQIFLTGISGRFSSGHGLAMISRYCESQGGEIFENGRFGRGARFVMRLPLLKGEGDAHSHR